LYFCKLNESVEMGTESDTTIRFSGLKPGRYNYHYSLGRSFFEGFENEEIKDANVEIDVMMERMERMLMFHFVIKGEVTVPCDRCLDPITLPIEGEETASVRFSDTEVSEDENVAVLPESAIEVDVAQWMYEFVAVRIPMQHVHEDPSECNPEVGRYLEESGKEADAGDDNIDPRWEALRNLK